MITRGLPPSGRAEPPAAGRAARTFHGFMSHAVGPLLRLALRPRVQGAANVPAEGPFILASNHLSFVDSFVLSPVIPRRVVYLAKSDYFELPGRSGRCVAWCMLALGNVPIRRGPRRAAVRALEQAASVLASGEVVGIYPEGTRSLDGRLYRGRTGVGWLALTTGVPVLPVALGGTDRIMPTGAWRPRLRVRPTVRIGEPMDFSRYRDLHPAKARRAVTDEVMETIRKLSGQRYTGRYNPGADA